MISIVTKSTVCAPIPLEHIFSAIVTMYAEKYNASILYFCNFILFFKFKFNFFFCHPFFNYRAAGHRGNETVVTTPEFASYQNENIFVIQ